MKKSITTVLGVLVGLSALGQSIDIPLPMVTGMESMAVGMVFKLVFIAQIFGLSFFLPQFLVRKAVLNSDDPKHTRSQLLRYTLLNNAIVILGFVVLALISFHPALAPVTHTLLAIGTYFLVQLAPIVLNRQLIENEHVAAHQEKSTLRLLEVVHPLAIGIAAFLFIAYLSVSLSMWEGAMDTKLLQMAIYTGFNAFLVFVIGKSFRNVQQSSGAMKRKHMNNLVKTAPVFTYMSIGISMYYFGKMFLLDFGLHGLRPIMMSLALLLLGLLIINQVGKYTVSKEH